MSLCAALIVAGGSGSRLGGTTGTIALPKQYRTLGGHPLLRHTVRAFAEHPRIGAVRVVIRPEDRALHDEALAGLAVLAPVTGGRSRQESVRLGLESLVDEAPSTILIHDAARPFVGAGLIGRVLDALETAPAVVPVLPVTDSLKRIEGEGAIVAAVDRANLVRAQTPQGFAFGTILEAHRHCAARGQGDLTDDAAVAALAGYPVTSVAGHDSNLKITTAEDLERAESMLGATIETRTGHGFDVHAFSPDRPGPLRLGGISLPHPHRLDGHSDADVALHALADALFGVAASGDLGEHFPPSDPRWADADSALFLRHAVGCLRDRGGSLLHVDLTIICEAPRIAPHREAMRQAISGILNLAIERVSVKATTTERLGALGRGEGIAAQALATAAFRSGS